MSIKEIENPQQEITDKTPKQIARELLDRLPDDVAWESLEYHLHVCRVVWESEKGSEKNGVFSDEEARERLKKWLD